MPRHHSFFENKQTSGKEPNSNNSFGFCIKKLSPGWSLVVRSTSSQQRNGRALHSIYTPEGGDLRRSWTTSHRPLGHRENCFQDCRQLLLANADSRCDGIHPALQTMSTCSEAATPGDPHTMASSTTTQ